MRTVFCVAATLVASVAASEPQNAQECREIYQKHSDELSSNAESKCEALVELSKCAGAFPTEDETEKTLISKQSKFCETFWDKLDAPSVRVAKDNMLMTVDDSKDIEFHRHRRETVNVFTMNNNIAQLLASVDLMKKTLDNKMDEIDTKLDANTKATEDTITKAVASLQKDQQDSQTSMSDSLNSFKGQIKGDLSKQATAMEKQSTDMTNAMSKQSKDMNDTLTKQSQTVDTAIDDLKDDVDASSAQLSKQLKGNVTSLTSAIADPIKHMWSGGAKSARYGGWQDFVLDRVEFDTAAPYFKKSSNTRFQALKDGLYSIRWNYRSYTHNTCYRQANIFVNDVKVVPDTHSYLYHWQEHVVQVTWPIKAGQVFYMRAYTHCGNPHAWEHGNTWRNAYNRVQVFYEGQINLDKKSCTSNQGLC